MSIEFRPALIDGVAVFVAIAGASRSGKTYSALRMARGIAGNRKIAAIDTETKRMSHYSKDFNFDVYNMRPPFRPGRFLEAAQRAEQADYAVLVIDSFSSEWTGAGGVLDWHEEELNRLAGEDEKQRSKKGQMAWIRPKQAHKAMMLGFLQLSMPVIFCLRAEDKTKPDANGIPQKIGWVPTQDKSFIYEWTVSLTLSPDQPGIVNYALPHKVEKQHRPLFPAGQLINEQAGAMLYAWANSDSVRQPAPMSQPSAAQADLAHALARGKTDRQATAPIGMDDRPTGPPETWQPDVPPPDSLPGDATGQAADNTGQSGCAPGPAGSDSEPTSPRSEMPGSGPGAEALARQPAREGSQSAKARKAEEFAEGLMAELALAQSGPALRRLLDVPATKASLLRMKDAWPELHDRISEAVAKRHAAMPPF